MAIRGTFTFNNGLTGNTATGSATVPGTVVAGDVLAVVSVQNTGTQTHTISGGGTGAWNVRSNGGTGPDDNNTNQRTYVWTKTAGSDSAGATVTITSTGSGELIGVGTAVSGILESGLQIALTSETTADTSLPWPGITVPTGGSGWLLIGLGTMRVGAATAATMTAPSNDTVDGSAATAQTTPNFSAYALHGNTLVSEGFHTFNTGAASAAVTDQLYVLGFAPAPTAASAVGSITLGGTATARAAASDAGSITLGGSGTATLPPGAVGSITLTGTAAAQARATAPGGAITLTGSPLPRAVAAALGALTLSAGLIQPSFRFQVWTGTGWKPITPLVWNGSSWVAIQVTVTPSVT